MRINSVLQICWSWSSRLARVSFRPTIGVAEQSRGRPGTMTETLWRRNYRIAVKQLFFMVFLWFALTLNVLFDFWILLAFPTLQATVLPSLVSPEVAEESQANSKQLLTAYIFWHGFDFYGSIPWFICSCNLDLGSIRQVTWCHLFSKDQLSKVA